MSRNAPRLGALFLATLLVTAACGGEAENVDGGDATPTATATATAAPTTESTETPDTGEAEVEIEDFAFQPERIEVAVGTEVKWNQRDDAPHTATAEDGSFDSGTLEKGDEFRYVFQAAGEYPYICEIHPEMTGTVVVS